MNYSNPRRIVIFGRSGSGKSTFAMKLGKNLKLPVYHLDKYFFLENWVPRNYEEFLKIQKCLVKNDSWIIDGNNSKSLEIRYKKADLVLYFNYPRFLCYWRVFKRLFFKDPTIKDRAFGCNETIRFELLKYMWGFEKKLARKVEFLTNKYPQIRFIEIKNDKNLAELKYP